MQSDPDTERLLTNMTVLTKALSKIEARYPDTVVVLDEDPVIFGAGHHVLYPLDHTRARFAIEEQYVGTDWTDENRLPSSWTWRSERLLRQRDGAHRWTALAHGEVQSDDVGRLVAQARRWAQRTHEAALQDESATRRSPDARRSPTVPPMSL